MAARNNPLIAWLDMPFDTFNLLHRWFGRIVVLEALTHMSAYFAEVVSSSPTGWAAVGEAIAGSQFIMVGVIVSIGKLFHMTPTDRPNRPYQRCSL